MKVILDGQSVAEESILKARTLGDLIHLLMQSGMIVPGRAVSAIMIDGLDISTSREGLETTVLSEGMTIEIRTETALSLLLSAIQDGRDSCLALEMDCRTASEKFRGTDIPAAAEFYAHLSSKIQMVLDYLIEIHRYILSAGLDLTDNQFDRIKVRFHSVLKEALGFQETSDWTMLADLLEYEFTDIFSEMSDFLDFAACSIKKPL